MVTALPNRHKKPAKSLVEKKLKTAASQSVLYNIITTFFLTECVMNWSAGEQAGGRLFLTALCADSREADVCGTRGKKP